MTDSSLQSTDDTEWMDEGDIWKKRGLGNIPQTNDITSLVEALLDQLQARITDAHEGLVVKMKAMDRRLDLLEQHISELIEYVTLKSSPTPSAVSTEPLDSPSSRSRRAPAA